MAKLIGREGQASETCLNLPKTVTGRLYSELLGFTGLACPAVPATRLAQPTPGDGETWEIPSLRQPTQDLVTRLEIKIKRIQKICKHAEPKS